MMGISSALVGARSVHQDNSSDIKIGSINVQTSSDTPLAYADAIRKGFTTHPLVSPAAQGTVTLATRGMVA
jgi:hypothetical protein